MMSLTFGLFTQVSGLGPLGPLVMKCFHIIKVMDILPCFPTLFAKENSLCDPLFASLENEAQP